MGLNKLGQIAHIDVDVIVHFEKEIDIPTVFIQPVEETCHFKRQIAIVINHINLNYVLVGLAG